jgi:2-C-methyl-D-erythritol 2,4-cyclodiphosphate synthase
MDQRAGFGFDIHRLEAGRELWLGGVRLPAEKGLAGHSDADVLIHAVCDALLGAAGLGDIGHHFPDTDPQYKDIDSKVLLARVMALLRKNGWIPVNLDTTVCLEKPRLSPDIPQIRKTLSGILGIDENLISVKAKTSEGIGFVGREEGISAYAVVLISRD